MVEKGHDDIMSWDPEFYEEDEPVENIIRAFERGEKGRTRKPAAGRTENLTIGALSHEVVSLPAPNQIVHLIHT